MQAVSTRKSSPEDLEAIESCWIVLKEARNDTVPDLEYRTAHFSGRNCRRSSLAIALLLLRKSSASSRYVA